MSRLPIVVALALVVAILAGCAAPSRTEWNSPYIMPESRSADAAADPGADSLFLALRGVPIEEMSDREFAYFQAKEAALEGREQATEVRKAVDRLAITWVVIMVGAVIGVRSAN